MLDRNLQTELCELNSEEESFLRSALTLLAQFDESLLTDTGILFAGITRLIAEIDRRMSLQVSAIIHDPAFSKLEAAWKGLETLTLLPVNYQKSK
ncbi:uncharacterized protein ImpD [Vibrio astriarenae]|nr:uncharacterized protein ImpD [Vibrio sp. C7]